MNPNRLYIGLGAAALCLAMAGHGALAETEAPATVPAAVSAQALEILSRSVAFRTFPGADQVPAYAAYLAGVLKAGGFAAEDIVITPFEQTAMLTARYPGSDPAASPIVLGGHMDVVPAREADWQRDPFTATIENGFVFGRGSADNKFGIMTMVASLVWLKAEGFQPSRDIVLALSGDEETAQATTAVLSGQLGNAALLLNSDAGGGLLGDDGRPVFYGVQAAEKTYVDFEITFASAGGHSSRPSRDNAIYSLARAIDHIAAYRFPTRTTELTRAYFRAAGRLTPGEAGAAMLRYAGNPDDADAIELLTSMPEHVGQLGTTCVATLLQAGHAANALPQHATATVNCRVFPGETIDDVRETLTRVIDDPAAQITVLHHPVWSDASPLRDDVMQALHRAIDLRAPGLPIVPQMSAGATDSLYFRKLGVPSYGVSGLFMHPRDNYAHGLDERVPLDSIDGALLQWHSLLTDLAR